MSWEIKLHSEVEAWYLAICESEPETGDLIEDAIDQLVHEGPTAGRPGQRQSIPEYEGVATAVRGAE